MLIDEGVELRYILNKLLTNFQNKISKCSDFMFLRYILYLQIQMLFYCIVLMYAKVII